MPPSQATVHRIQRAIQFWQHRRSNRFVLSDKTISVLSALVSDRQIAVYDGRHTFISHALAGGRTLAEIRDAAGHCNVSITSGYLHVAVDDEAAVGNLFPLS